MISGSCDFVYGSVYVPVHILEERRPQLLAPNVVHVEVKGQGHVVFKCAASVGVQVNMTAEL